MPNSSYTRNDDSPPQCASDNPENYFSSNNSELARIIVSPCLHRGEKRLQLRFSYNDELIGKVRKIPGCRWSATMHCWHVADSNECRKELENLQINHPCIKIILKKGSEVKHEQIDVRLDINNTEGIIYIEMPFNERYKEKIKSIPGSWWHPGAKLWSVKNSAANFRYLKEIFAGSDCHLTINTIHNNLEDRQTYKKALGTSWVPKDYLKQLQLENKSTRTIEIYTSFINQFLEHFKKKTADMISDDMIRDYILDHRIKKGYSESYQNQLISSLRSFYRNQYDREFTPEILPRPRKSRYLPKVLSKEDVQRMITICKNEKHKMIVLMLYGFGLRLSELVHLRIRDIDFAKRQLKVVAGKGRKDRILPIPDVIIRDIQKYLKSYLPNDYFFKGQGGELYSGSSIQHVVKRLALQAGIKRNVTPHILRHCYATHLLEKGTDLRYIQNLLGHRSSKTTEIYTHVTVSRLIELANPLDDMKF